MTPTPKQLLQKNDELRAQLSAVVSSDWFKNALCFVRAELLSRPNITPDMQHGMNLYEGTLLAFTDPEPKAAPAMTSGLQHDMRDLRQREGEEKKKT